MNELRKRWLTENDEGVTLAGSPTGVSGWGCGYASLAPTFGGFWRVDWEIVERVLAGDRNFTAQDVTLGSWRWLGTGDKVPESMSQFSRVDCAA